MPSISRKRSMAKVPKPASSTLPPLPSAPPSKPSKASIKPTQPSRKGKKAWRKNVDTSDQKLALDQKADDERVHGTSHISLKPSQDLFFVDKRGDDEIKRRERLRPLRIHEIVKPKSLVPAIVSRPSGRDPKQMNSLLKEKVLTMAKKRKSGSDQKVQVAKKTKSKAAYDVWEKEDVPLVQPDSFITHVNIRKPNAPASVGKPIFENMPAVKAPPPGASYNPSFDQHQELLQGAVDEEMTKMRKKEEVAAMLRYPAHLDLLDSEMEVDGDSEDGDSQNEGQSDENEADDSDDDAKMTAPDPKRRTRTDRRGVRRQHAQDLQEHRKAARKSLNKQISQLKTLVAEVETEEQERLVREEREKFLAANPDVKAVRLGPHMFKPSPTDLLLTEELPSCLRQLMPQGSAIKDRLKSLEERGILEPRVRVGLRRRYKVTYYEKVAYRFFDRRREKTKEGL